MQPAVILDLGDDAKTTSITVDKYPILQCELFFEVLHASVSMFWLTQGHWNCRHTSYTSFTGREVSRAREYDLRRSLTEIIHPVMVLKLSIVENR